MRTFSCFIGKIEHEIDECFDLSEQESKHLKVFRAQKNDFVVLLTGCGVNYFGKILDIKNRAKILLREKISCEKRKYGISLIQAIPAVNQMDLIIQKATEIGVYSIFPIVTERTTWQIKTHNLEEKQERWKKIAIAACKQSKNSFLPIIHPVNTLENALKESCKYIEKIDINFERNMSFLCSLKSDAKNISKYLNKFDSTDHITIAVGPEGDFSPEEYSLFEKENFLPLKLTNTVLRTETAAIYSISLIDGCLSFEK